MAWRIGSIFGRATFGKQAFFRLPIPLTWSREVLRTFHLGPASQEITPRKLPVDLNSWETSRTIAKLRANVWRLEGFLRVFFRSCPLINICELRRQLGRVGLQ